MGFFDKLKAGLQKTKEVLLAPIDNLFSSYDKVDDDFYEELCDLLIMADVGAGSSQEIVEKLKAVLKEKKIKETSAARNEFIEILKETVGNGEPLNIGSELSVILVIGVNGVGKTTSIGKISANLKKDGKKVMLAAADTFRAAAIDQLEIWANRSNVPLIRQGEGADPAAVVFDALSAAKKQGIDVLIVDTAGRLHNKKNLLDELAKINRVIDRELPNGSRETLLVLDASTGQNALIQAKEFRKAANISGIVLTKLDGTAKGGIILSIKRELGIPVKYIGVGESIDDLQPFNAEQFVQAFFDTKNGVK
ncbi:MAG: signal recognition particle-docking protein FtsY [Clostridiales bacterium GWF2_36_10]|nr:MAG: signal recognition particle-docking protein FtsY [Clostridiales bacterium GWF2_36_10]HAN21131.1 signal recognition particle-docking protein FtsY [Clostridiales bacterium]